MSATITYRPSEAGIILACQMEIGQCGIFRCKPPAYNGLIVMMTQKQIVSLNRPELTWDRNCAIQVKLLEPGTKIEIVVQK